MKTAPERGRSDNVVVDEGRIGERRSSSALSLKISNWDFEGYPTGRGVKKRVFRKIPGDIGQTAIR